MPRIATRDAHANLAVDLFDQIMESQGWGLDNAWLGIATLLINCQVWMNGSGWQDFPVMPAGTPVLMERNNYKRNADGEPNQSIRDAVQVRNYLAESLGVEPENLCNELGLFFQPPEIIGLQPNNPRGHAFRSLIAHVLSKYGDSQLTVAEEQNAHQLLPGFPLGTRSANPDIDIVVHRNDLVVAIISTRWTYRHDRVDMLDEAHAYVPPARKQNPRCDFYGVTAEMVTARLNKVVHESEGVAQNPIVRSLVHLHAPLATNVIGRNGSLDRLMDLTDFVLSSFNWE